MHKHLGKLALLSLLYIALSVPSTAFARRLDDSDRLSLLNRTTGSSSESNAATFESRVNSILDRTPTTNRAKVVADDKLIRQNLALEALPQEPLKVAGYSLSKKEDDWRKDREKLEKEKNEKSEKKESREIPQDGKVDFKLDGSDREYFAKRDEIFRKADQKLEERRQERLEFEKQKAALQTKQEPAEKPGFLENNPFYFGPTELPSPNEFALNRPLIVNRLMFHGLDQDEATELVSSATGPDDLVIKLMQVDDGEEFSYGDALEMVGVG